MYFKRELKLKVIFNFFLKRSEAIMTKPYSILVMHICVFINLSVLLLFKKILPNSLPDYSQGFLY